MKFDLEKLKFIECDIESSKLAIAGSDKDLTWSELKEEVEKLKQKLTSYSLPIGHPVVIYGHKEVGFIISMIACMSLQISYIPVDTIYPKKRLDKISNIVKSAILIDTVADTIEINENNLEVSYYEKDPIIYTIFTSGSTGEPKGVQITKSSILDFKQWLGSDFNFSKKNVFMNQAPFSFDLSVYEVMGFLLFGGSIILHHRKLIENSTKYLKNISKYNCNTWVSTPSFIKKYLLSDDFNRDEIPSLSQFIFCGETLPPETAKKVLGSYPNSVVLNSYGPTEATVAVTLIAITKEIINKYYKNLPVGYVKKSSKINLLNMNKHGVGELEIVGDNVSIGYFKNEALNQEKFQLKDNKRSFKTGDYGYFEDGMLFFSNREDDLVKLHGFRIELGEIDGEILKNNIIKDTITIPLKRSGETVKIISFVVSNKSIPIEDVKINISRNLPYYMIPSDIIQINKLPYNTNHKIDKNKLLDLYASL